MRGGADGSCGGGGVVEWGGVGYFLIPMIAIYLHILNVRGYPFVYLAVG